MIAIHRPTRLAVDQTVIASNTRLLRQAYGSSVSMMAIVKADAYGHGAVATSQTVLANGADRLAVALVDEALELREAGLKAPILVLGGAHGTDANAAVKAGIALAAQDAGDMERLRHAARLAGCRALAHIKIDTGMSRLGARDEGELRALLNSVGDDGSVFVEGAFTHYCDPLNRTITLQQHDRFVKALSQCRAAGFSPIAHGAATEASLLYPEARDDIVRPGLALYGGCSDILSGLRWAMRLTSRPLRIARIEPGETVGYGRSFCAQRPTLVMTVPIGYADGYPRLAGGRGWVLVRGTRAPVIGRVCMDMLMLDVTDVPGVSCEDEVTLLGAQGADAITPDDIAGWAETISYEILTGFHGRIVRGDSYEQRGTASGNT